ncbi:hypothetical protein [Pseudomonas nitroreducens]|uniref:Uncharacterized protein n=1 Tax=Pseudomonas nitroreducens TaxID=46680 RepID=A0A6G6J4G3_PSENT|nr:hypothetical protein [Pseudomonas nitroreducens]QIE89950.1 hypothetical protein G5B91_28365 [Pseudomonas nitroreducens]
MKIFLISQESASGRLPEVAGYLSQIELPASLLTPVVVIDEREWRREKGAQLPSSRSFQLDDFLHARGSVANGEITADANVVGDKLCATEESWLFIDLGLHHQTVSKDFIRKLATFTFLFRGLQGRSLVLLMPRLYLGFMGRYVNEVFNNVPASFSADDGASRFSLFLLSTVVEKLYMSSPVVAWPISKARQLVRFFYERLIRVKA